MKRYYRKKSIGNFPFVFIMSILLVIINRHKIYNLKTNLVMIASSLLGTILLILLIKKVSGRIKANKKNKKYLESGITIVDTMTGKEFEEFLLAHFSKLGYKGQMTKTTNDYGADLLLSKETEKIVVQAKRYKTKVGIKAIQELVSSIQYYKANKGYVITNNFFTVNAQQLAEANGIELWDRVRLVDIMNKNSSKQLAEETYNKAEVEKSCPDCGSKLHMKNGKYGQFLGCSNYPKCNFTRKVQNN